MSPKIRFASVFAISALAFACGAEPDTADPTSSGAGAGGAVVPDADGDGISDTDEGAAENRDTDGDGIPDYQDADSDNDGILDSEEAGDSDATTPPVDSDGDGDPDFIDLDSDGNGIDDAVEGNGDVDNDGIGDYADTDNDGDGINDEIEIGGDPNAPLDSDGDGTADYLDIDSDNDTIADGDERAVDPDMDGIPSYLDLDSDGDCVPDASEAGDSDVSTAPYDNDSDGQPNFHDKDSDNDGLADGAEDQNCNGVLDPGETSSSTDDTDGDGVTDLVEQAAGTDPQDPADNPQANGDFVFLVPYQEPPSPTDDALDFSTAFQNVDIYFMIDYSGSMSGEITSISNNITQVIDDLACGPGETPQTTGCIPSLETGVGQYGGQAGVNPVLEHLKDINAINVVADGANSTEALVPTSAPGWGNEYHLQAMNAALTSTCASDPNRFAKACYRNNSLRLFVMVTDEPFSQDPAWNNNTYQPYVDNAYNSNVRAIGVYSGGGVEANMAALQSGGNPLFPVLSSTNLGTPACNALAGQPFYQNPANTPRAIILGTNADAANALTCAVQAVTQLVPQDVRAVPVNDPNNQDAGGNAIDAPAAFIDKVEVFMDGSALCPTYSQTQDSDGDGYQDVFVGILPGEGVCWKIYAKMNGTVQPSTEPQMFRAFVEVYGVGNSLLDTRDVFFLVPPDVDDVVIPR